MKRSQMYHSLLANVSALHGLGGTSSWGSLSESEKSSRSWAFVHAQDMQFLGRASNAEIL